MRRLLLILRRALLALAVVALAAVLAWHLVVPGIVEDRIRAALVEAGFDEAELRIRTLGLHGAEITGLRLDTEARVAADSIFVEFDPFEILSGQLETVTVSGATVDLRVREGKVDSGPLGKFRGGGGEPGGELPFDLLVLRHGRFVLDLDGTRYVLPVDGVLRPGEGNAIGVSITTRFGLRELAVTGTVEMAGPSGRADLLLEGPDGERLAVDLTTVGPVTEGDLEVGLRGEVGAVDRVIAGRRIRLAGASLRGRVSVRGFRRFPRADLALTADAPAVDGFALERLAVALAPGGPGPDLAVTAVGGFGEATLEASLPPLSLDLRAGEVPLSLSARGYLTGRLLDFARAAGIDATGALAAVTAKGRVAAGGPDWSVDVSEANLELRAGAVTHLPSGGGAEAIAAHLLVAARAGPEEIALAVRTTEPLTFRPRVPGVIPAGTGTVSVAARRAVEVRVATGTGDWSATIPEVDVGLLDLAPTAGRLAAAGVGGEMRLAGRAGPDGFEVALPDGGRLRADGLFTEAVDLSTVEVRIEEGASFGRSRATGDYRLDARLAVDLASTGAAEIAGALRAEDLAGTVALAAGIEGSDLWLRVRPGTTLRASSLAAGGFEVAPAVIRPGADEESPAVRVSLAAAGDATATGRVEVAEPFRLRGPGLAARVLALAVTGEVATADSGLVAAAGYVDVVAEEIRVSSAEVAAGRVDARIPLGIGREAALPSSARILREGTVRIERLRWRGDALPPPTLVLSREGAEMSFRADWPLTDVATLTADGRLGLDAGRPVGRARVDVPRFALHPGGRISTALETATGFAFTGEMSLAGSIDIEGSHVTPALDVGVYGMTARSEDGEQAIEGLGAKIRIDGFAPLSTAGGQLLTFDSAKLGELAVQDGRVRFTLESPRSILLERAEWRLGSTGRFWVYSFRLDPARPDVEIELFTEHLSLDEWLGLVTADHASGEGELFGRLRVHIVTEPRLDVTVRSGFLHAEGSGKIRIHDTEAIRGVLADNIPSFEGETDYSRIVQDRIVKALEDFGFTSLKFDIFENERGGMTLRANVEGKGVEPPHQELDLTVNVNGFEELIDPALSLKLGIDRTKAGLLDRLRIGK